METGMADKNPLEKARELAREAAHEMELTATETDRVVEGMYELDGIIIDDGECDVACVIIMYDEATDQYALVNEMRRDPEERETVAEAAERETRRAALLQEIQLKAMMALDTCQSGDDVAATWAAIDSIVAQSVRMRVGELGEDVDAVRQDVDRFFLKHPELR
jgi:hypothetical protein